MDTTHNPDPAAVFREAERAERRAERTRRAEHDERRDERRRIAATEYMDRVHAAFASTIEPDDDPTPTDDTDD